MPQKSVPSACSSVTRSIIDDKFLHLSGEDTNFIFILLGYKLILPLGGRAHKRQEKDKKQRQVRREKKKEDIRTQRETPPSRPQATDALIGDENQNDNRRKKKKKETGNSPIPSYLRPFGHLLQPSKIILKHPTQSRATDALIGEQSRTENRREQTGSGSPTQLFWTIQSPPTTCRDHA